MFEKMGKAGLLFRIVSPSCFQVYGDLRAVEVRHLNGNQVEAIVQGFIVTSKHQTSVIIDTLYHIFKVTEKEVVVKGFGARDGVKIFLDIFRVISKYNPHDH
jgi:hypothetical protein